MIKNNLTTIKTNACILAAMAGLASTASAAFTITPGTGGNNQTSPGEVEISDGSTNTWTTFGGDAYRILDIQSSSTFVLQDGNSFQVGQGGTNNTSGFLKINNGSTLRIEGGTFEWEGRVESVGGLSNTFQVVGNTATISGRQLNNPMTYDFDFNAGGISTITTSSSMVFSSSALDVNVASYDFSSLAPSASTSFTLFNASNLSSGFDLGNVTIAGLDALDYSWALVQDVGGVVGTDDIVLQVTAVPEPSAYALIGGLLALGSVMMRRRRS